MHPFLYHAAQRRIFKIQIVGKAHHAGVRVHRARRANPNAFNRRRRLRPHLLNTKRNVRRDLLRAARHCRRPVRTGQKPPRFIRQRRYDVGAP